MDLSKFKGKNLTTGETLKLESYVEGAKKTKQETKAAEILEKFLKSPKYKKDASYQKLINKNLDIGRTPDNKKVVAKVLTVKKRKIDYEKQTKNNELPLAINSCLDEEKNNSSSQSGVLVEDGIMVNTVESFEIEEIITSPLISPQTSIQDIDVLNLAPLKNNAEFEFSMDAILKDYRCEEVEKQYFKNHSSNENNDLSLIDKIFEDHQYSGFKKEHNNTENQATKSNNTDLDLINDILEEHKYTEFSFGDNIEHQTDKNDLESLDLINEILEDHNYTDFRLEYFRENGIEGENEYLIGPDEQEDPISSSYNSLLSMNITAHHNYSCLSKNSKIRATAKPFEGDSTETVNLHEYPKKVLIKNNKPTEESPKKSSKTSEDIQKRVYKTRFSCAMCKRSFLRPSALHKHSQYCNSDKGKYSCSFCGCSFPFASSLTRHVVQKHVDRTTAKFKPELDNNGELYSGIPNNILTGDSIILEEENELLVNNTNLKANENQDDDSVGYSVVDSMTLQEDYCI